jgi:hypothetical protein
MEISEKQIRTKRTIGKLGDQEVLEMFLKGGLYVVGVKGRKQVLGMGSHRGVARYLAEKAEPNIQINALEKNETLSPAAFADLIPRYEQMTATFNALLAGK